MAPLTCQRTRESILSWWSDSNPTGPNSNLHAAAKPLIKFLYHRQALDYIAKNRGAPPSKETLEICSSYLACRYISSSTKIRILGELDLRPHCEEDPRTVLAFVDEWLDSDGVEVWIATCRMLGHLAGHIPVGEMCRQLVSSLLRDEKLTETTSWALDALRKIAQSPEGAQACVNANVLDCVAKLLESPSAEVRRHEAHVSAVLGIAHCDKLVCLLRVQDPVVGEWALRVLTTIASSPEGQAVVDARALSYLPQLIETRDFDVRAATLKMLRALAGNKAVLGDTKVCQQLVSLLRDENRWVIETASQALYWMTTSSSEGAQAAVDANVMDRVTELGLLGRKSNMDL
ncbi:armadillo-type protein [Mycena vulgaris]|nr:armadillo-type protein [Mycena vulgaris]